MICSYDGSYCQHQGCRCDGCRKAAWPLQSTCESSGGLTVQRLGVAVNHDCLATETEEVADDRTGHEEA